MDPRHGASRHQPVLLLMDSPRKPSSSKGEDGFGASDDKERVIRQPTLVQSVVGEVPPRIPSTASSSDSLGRLLVEMTAQVQDERSKRSDVEKRNQALLLEIEQLQKEMIELKTSREQRRRASGDWDGATRPDDDVATTSGSTPPRDANAEFWWRELQEAKKTKDKALAEAHQRAMQVMELNACVSMQHDELKALRNSENEVRAALNQAEERSKELLQQNTILVQESHLLKDEVTHLNTEMGKRGVHFKALMDKWTESQAQSEHLERENHAMLDKMKEIRQRNEQLQHELTKAHDERDLLQHQVNHLKGAVAAKAAESKAFQAYGTNARDHLQAQTAIIQRHQIYRRKIHEIARGSVVLLKSIKTTLATIRAPLVTIQGDFRSFLKNLQAPVFTLVARSRRYAEVVHIEHQPLRLALRNAELSRTHLHEQLWRARRNAMLICQIRNTTSTVAPSSTTGNISTADTILGAPLAPATAIAKQQQPPQRTLRANYSTAELLLRESEKDTVTVKFDAIYSDRSREWNNYESIMPLLQSVLDGYNACVTTFDGLLPLKTTAGGDSGMTVPELVLTQLFTLLHANGAQFHRIKLTISFLAVYNENIYDLLSLDATSTATAQISKILVLEVQNAEEALLVLRGGLENLAIAHEQGGIDQSLTHRVITLCVSHENLLSASQVTKSKLQIVEFAAGPSEGEQQTKEWEDRDRVKTHVMMENGIQALVTTLADVRTKDSTFVRYHSSKLTVLLQDTIKASAKFMAIVAMPATGAGTVSANPSVEYRAAQVTRWLQQFRGAVGSFSTIPNGHLPADRSVEGFINRFTAQSEATGSSAGVGSSLSSATGAVVAGGGGSGTASLVFASSSDGSRACLEVDPRQWEKELDGMGKRYGDLQRFTTTFYEPPTNAAHDVVTTTTTMTATSEVGSGHDSPMRKSATTGLSSLTDVVIHPEELAAMGMGSSMPPPAPTTTKSSGRHKSKTAAHHRATISHMQRTSLARMKSTHASRAHSVAAAKGKHKTGPVGPHLSTMTLAPRHTMHHPLTTKAVSIVKLRRETASSALKKTLATKRTEQWTQPPTGKVATDLARLQKQKVPFR